MLEIPTAPSPMPSASTAQGAGARNAAGDALGFSGHLQEALDPSVLEASLHAKGIAALDDASPAFLADSAGAMVASVPQDVGSLPGFPGGVALLTLDQALAPSHATALALAQAAGGSAGQSATSAPKPLDIGALQNGSGAAATRGFSSAQQNLVFQAALSAEAAPGPALAQAATDAIPKPAQVAQGVGLPADQPDLSVAAQAAAPDQAPIMGPAVQTAKPAATIAPQAAAAPKQAPVMGPVVQTAKPAAMIAPQAAEGAQAAPGAELLAAKPALPAATTALPTPGPTVAMAAQAVVAGQPAAHGPVSHPMAPPTGLTLALMTAEAQKVEAAAQALGQPGTLNPQDALASSPALTQAVMKDGPVPAALSGKMPLLVKDPVAEATKPTESTTLLARAMAAAAATREPGQEWAALTEPVLRAVTPEAALPAAFHSSSEAQLEAPHVQTPLMAPMEAASRPSESALPSAAARDGAPPPPPTRQLAPVLVSLALGGSDDTLTIALDPVELGRVEVTISQGKEASQVRIVAERPETLALLQRDQRELDRALTQAGLGDMARSIAFSLSSDQGRQHQQGSAHDRGHQGTGIARLGPANGVDGVDGGRAMSGLPAPHRSATSLIDIAV